MENDRAKLVVVKGNHKGETWTLTSANYYSIGRGEDNAIHLSDPTVSTRHALLECADGIWFIRDLGSKHGTWVEGEQVEERHAVFHKDVIRVGKTYLVMGMIQEGNDKGGAARWTEDVDTK